MSEREEALTDQAVAEGGAYEVLHARLLEQSRTLSTQAEKLNEARLAEFGSTEMSVLKRIRMRTENNCVGRDIANVGEYLLLGYNVFLGLKRETKVEDVFALYQLDEESDGVELAPVPIAGTFLADSRFQQDFKELYAYYRNTRLLQTVVKGNRLLTAFQMGERLEDIRVFRWSIDDDGKRIEYLDNRGERDIQPPPTWDFEWQATEREDTVQGRHPHVNILDTVFVETINGTLTLKIEDNTEDGQGVFSEPVEDTTQSIDDAEFEYARIGELILIRILPYREEQWRYLVYCEYDQSVHRIDAIGQSCVQLPEDNGVIFPGGILLQNGEVRMFDNGLSGMRFKRRIRSPNGEDYLYIFYEPEAGRIALFNYNLIDKQLRNPIDCHGYAALDDGRIVIFPGADEEPKRLHSMQIWRTPFVAEHIASSIEPADTFCGRIGNAELVRGISDLKSVVRQLDNTEVSERLFADLSGSSRRLFDSYYWLKEDDTTEIATTLEAISETASMVLDEYAKVESIRAQSAQALQAAEGEVNTLLQSVRPESWQEVGEFIDVLGALRTQRGQLLTIRDYRYMDVERIDELESTIAEAQDSLAARTGDFLSSAEALEPYKVTLGEVDARVQEADVIVDLEPVIDELEKLAGDLDLLSELVATLPVADATQHTAIVEAVTAIFADLNQSRARAKARQRDLGASEASAQFAAQFKLFSQGISNALAIADDPASCDEQLSRLLVQLEEIESQFGEHEEFLADILGKREELYESFEAHKQALLDARQRKAQSLMSAADRILAGIGRRLEKFSTAAELNAFFASDATAMKLRELADRLRELEDEMRASDIEARLKGIRDQAVRALRDRSELYEDAGNVVKLGPRHRFSVNSQSLDLTIIPRDERLNFHLVGTEYFEPVRDESLVSLARYWSADTVAESEALYRGEYLAGCILDAAAEARSGLSLEQLHEAMLVEGDLERLAREFAADRYREGYEKGVHDHDAARILEVLIPLREAAGLLSHDPLARGLAIVFWANQQAQESCKTWPARAASASQMQSIFARSDAVALLQDEASAAIAKFVQSNDLPLSSHDAARAGQYLVLELASGRAQFAASKYAVALRDDLSAALKRERAWSQFNRTLEELAGQPGHRWMLTRSWIEALVASAPDKYIAAYIPEAIALVNADARISFLPSECELEYQVEDLLGTHTLIEGQSLSSSVDSFSQRYRYHRDVFVLEYQDYLKHRQSCIETRRDQMRLDDFKPRPLSTFVRNKLINDVYLPIIGDNLAKQIGVAGDSKRTDLMGLLMLISPPGYGKTTLMEYVAHRLGLVFMKINCPSLGHSVNSVDPAQAPDATSAQELEKLNLAFEMRDNIMLYLDDIQHTSPEFLQKFISLCDATRRIDGVFNGETKTYDLRGKRFCVVMAGNPYTESGEVFRIPDMLANRADVYNLGDVLSGSESAFEQSYLENCLTSNPVLAPLATRSMQDVYLLLAMAAGSEVSTNELEHGYSAAEVGEIVSVFQKLMRIRDVILKVNAQYIASAAQDDQYRDEPPFKLQGSYRNMNRLAESASAVMTDEELDVLIADHYRGEAQLLTTGAEENLLKLAELLGTLDETQAARWEAVKSQFRRNKAMGGEDADAGTRVVAQLVDLVGEVRQLGTAANQLGKSDTSSAPGDTMQMFREAMDRVADAVAKPPPEIQVINKPLPGMNKVLAAMADTIENSIYPLLRVLDKKLEIDLDEQRRLRDIAGQLRSLQEIVEPKTRTSAGPKAKPED